MARIESQDLALDLVPAGVFTRKSDNSTFYNLAKGDGDDGWILTSPREDIEELDDAAEDRPNLKNIIRIVKRVRDQYGLGVSSFALERQVLRYARDCGFWSQYLAVELPYAVRSVADAIEAGKIPDLFNPSSNLLADARDRRGAACTYRSIAQDLDELYENQGDYDADDLYEAVHDLLENE